MRGLDPGRFTNYNTEALCRFDLVCIFLSTLVLLDHEVYTVSPEVVVICGTRHTYTRIACGISSPSFGDVHLTNGVGW